jgi:hypothetical protein
MTSKERVKMAFAHKQPDKTPVDFGGMSCSNINVCIVRQLRDYYGLEKRPIKVKDMSVMTGILDTDLMEVLGCDVRELDPYADNFGNRPTDWKEWTYRGETVLIPKMSVFKTDEKRGTFVYPQGDSNAAPSGYMPADGFYFDNLMHSPPFDEGQMDPMEQAEDSQIASDEMLEFHKQKMTAYKSENRAIQVSPGYFGIGDANNIPGPNLKNPKGIRDLAEWYMAPLLYPEYVNKVFDIECERAIETFRKYHDAFGDDIDIVYIDGTDFGTQRSPMINPVTFKEMYVPHYKKMCDWVHKNTSWKTLKHCCGGIFPLIPLMIEAGFDALNPVQCSADGMDPKTLKEAFGKDILFWGAGVDTQKILPFGTPEEVRRQALERLEIFSKGGGFIFNTIHNIQANTPVKNIAAMIEGVKEFNGDK